MDTENKSRKSEVGSQKSENKTAIFYITNNGLRLAESLKRLYPNTRILRFNSEVVYELWNKCKNLIFIMATGIVVRIIALLIKDKKTDPAVVVLDEKGEYAISLLGGHLGGANQLAREITDFLGGEAVITTASDVNNMPSIDLWAKENNLIIDNWDFVPKISTRFLNNDKLRVYSDTEINMPNEFSRVADSRFADVLITNKEKIGHLNKPVSLDERIKVIPAQAGIQRGKSKKLDSCLRRNDNIKHSHVEDKKQGNGQLYLRPKNLIIGIGCNSRTSEREIGDTVKETLEGHNLSFHSIHSLATIDKKGNEPGLVEFARTFGFAIQTFTTDELNRISLEHRVRGSDNVVKATGAYAVAEPSALLASGTEELLVKKQKIGNVTIAIAQRKSGVKSQESKVTGKIYIVGTGPGGIEHITPCAQNAIRKSDVIVGYETYLDLIKEFIKDKEVISTGMTQEVERCKKAVELALSGKAISVISGGDPGIYAMAGLVFEILRGQGVKGSRGQEVNTSVASSNPQALEPSSNPVVKVIPGIPALSACAARLGAPLMHDFASISLSDRLTPWELIEKRLEAAAIADYVIVLYNPKSKGRPEYIVKARDIILRYRTPETPVGIVKSAMRENEKIIITNLKDMLDQDIDMQSTVIIGNSQTFLWEGWMITPRGYEKKFKV